MKQKTIGGSLEAIKLWFDIRHELFRNQLTSLSTRTHRYVSWCTFTVNATRTRVTVLVSSRDSVVAFCHSCQSISQKMTLFDTYDQHMFHSLQLFRIDICNDRYILMSHHTLLWDQVRHCHRKWLFETWSECLSRPLQQRWHPIQWCLPSTLTLLYLALWQSLE